jgi:EARP and GARP complex-interacting protein 1
MFSNQYAELIVDSPVKCLEAVRGDKLESRFLVGASSLHDANELTVLRFHAEMNELGIDAKLDHPSGPVGVLCTSPTDKCLLLSAAEENPTVNLWRVPDIVMEKSDDFDYSPDGGGTNAEVESYSLDLVTTLPHDPDSHIVDILWRDKSLVWDEHDEIHESGDVLTMDRTGHITMWDIETVQSVRSETIHDSSQTLPPQLTWDPHNVACIAVTAGQSIHVLDWRTDTTTSSGTFASSFIAHRYGVTSIDFNPNKPNSIVTAGQDGLLKFWDLRNTKRPTLTARGGHSHYVWRVQYNPSHDQLVVSTGTDGLVNLWRVSSISSAPLLALGNTNSSNHHYHQSNPDSASESSASDARISRFEHGDSVYGMSWGAADAWIYATAAYDGKVVLHHVPSKEKYKILL